MSNLHPSSSLARFCSLFLITLAVASPGHAEFSCSAEISYSWLRTEEPSSPSKGGATPSASPAPAASPTEQLSVYVATVSANGGTEELAKAALAEPITKGKAVGLTRCKDEHENQARCVALKYTSMAQVLNSLGFTARKELEKTISSDCHRSTGHCISTTASEPICRTIVAAEPKAEEAAADGKGKDEKGKDSKKKK